VIRAVRRFRAAYHRCRECGYPRGLAARQGWLCAFSRPVADPWRATRREARGGRRPSRILLLAFIVAAVALAVAAVGAYL